MTTEPHTLAAHIAATVTQLRRERGWSRDKATATAHLAGQRRYAGAGAVCLRPATRV